MEAASFPCTHVLNSFVLLLLPGRRAYHTLGKKVLHLDFCRKSDLLSSLVHKRNQTFTTSSRVGRVYLHLRVFLCRTFHDDGLL